MPEWEVHLAKPEKVNKLLGPDAHRFNFMLFPRARKAFVRMGMQDENPDMLAVEIRNELEQLPPEERPAGEPVEVHALGLTAKLRRGRVPWKRQSYGLYLPHPIQPDLFPHFVKTLGAVLRRLGEKPGRVVLDYHYPMKPREKQVVADLLKGLAEERSWQ